MNKKKILLLSSSFAIVPLLSPIVVSAASNNDPNNKKPELDPNFGEFESEAKKTIASTIEDGLKAIINYLQVQQQRLLENKELEFKLKIQQLIYLKNLETFLTKNKEEIKKDPNKYGIYLNTPLILGKEKNHDLQDIDYEGDLFKSIKTGKSDPLDYKKAILPKGSVKEVAKDQLNAIKKDKYSQFLKKYKSDFLKEVNKLFFNEKDVLNIDKDVELIRDKNGVFSTTLPKGFKSWDEYFISKFKVRITKFDLKQNQETNEAEQKEEKNPDSLPDLKPLVDGDKTSHLTKEQEKNLIQSLPLLVPFISSNNLPSSLSQIKSQFDSLDANKRQELFYFNNPINTRYKYSVFSFDISGNDIINLKVHISDNINPKLERTYLIEKYTPSQDKYFNLLKETEIKAISEIFKPLYKGLGLDEKLDYNKLRNGYLRKALLAMIDSALQMSFKTDKDSYSAISNKILQKYWVKLQGDKTNTKKLLEEFGRTIRYTFFSYLNSLVVNNIYFWTTIAKAYNLVQLQFSEALKFNEKFIKTNLAEIKGNENVLRELFLLNKQLNYKFTALISQRDFNQEKWYSDYLELLSSIKHNFDLLSNLASNISIKANKEEKENFNKAYLEAVNVLNKNYLEQKKIIKKLGTSFVVISLIIIITNIIIFALLKNLKLKKKVIIINSVILAIALLILIIGGLLFI
ncbi:MSC_0620 family F1-like ATPase-associated subunit [Metamycoplasma hominis]|uniref:MSC_0620 family F1-like ATPase-associated subunit n=1 Tax=Metamycoplasma hominis TaxID=2098 RepID=UPI003CEEDE2F